MTRGSILITGCSSGIGYCCAHRLQARGYRVIASARQPADVERLQAEGLMCVQLDLSSDASIQAGLAAALAHTGGQIDFLFNNAGYGQAGALEDLTRPVWRQQFETNLFGTMELTRQVLVLMRKQASGRIVFNSSLLGYAALAYRGAYNASKFALEGVADTLRLELHGSGIQISLIEPGPILAAFRANSLKTLDSLDISASAHREAYAAIRQRLAKPGAAVPYTLPPDAVCNALIKALESPKARARYPVTLPAHLFYWLKRLLPTYWLDRVLIRSGGNGRR